MSPDIKNTLILAGAFLMLFAIAELLYHKFSIKAEYTRKLVHIGTGLLALLFPVMLRNHWLVLLLCATFAAILVISLYFRLLPSINAIERKSVGSLAYPLAVYTCYLAYDYYDGQFIYYYLPVIILAVCDPVAALTGRKWQWGKYAIGKESKTLMGSLMFLVTAMILVIVCTIRTGFVQNTSGVTLTALMIGIISSVTEAVSKKGWDNFTIPVSVLLGLVLSHQIFSL